MAPNRFEILDTAHPYEEIGKYIYFFFSKKDFLPIEKYYDHEELGADSGYLQTSKKDQYTYIFKDPPLSIKL